MRIIIILAVLTLAGCENTHPTSKVGKWCESHDNGKTCRSYTSYFKDGGVYSYGTFEEYGVRYIAKGTWYHKGQLSCIEAEYTIFDIASNKVAEKYSANFCNKILSLSGDVFIYEDREGVVNEMFLLSKTPNKSMQPTPNGAG